jgi:hypothetical protein
MRALELLSSRKFGVLAVYGFEREHCVRHGRNPVVGHRGVIGAEVVQEDVWVPIDGSSGHR